VEVQFVSTVEGITSDAARVILARGQAPGMPRNIEQSPIGATYARGCRPPELGAMSGTTTCDFAPQARLFAPSVAGGKSFGSNNSWVEHRLHPRIRARLDLLFQSRPRAERPEARGPVLSFELRTFPPGGAGSCLA